MKLIIQYLALILLLLVSICCSQSIEKKIIFDKDQEGIESSQVALIKKRENYFSNQVMVVAHRGDWRNAPENSMEAIQNCIAMGVDMVEIDLKKTKDGQIILMHDKTLERTSSGKGIVKNVLFDSIKKLYLKNGYGMATHHRIPVLREALMLCKDKILVFLDKGYNYIPEVMAIVIELEMEDQVFFEGKVSLEDLKTDSGKYFTELNYMPRVNKGLNTNDYLDEYLNHPKESIFILSFHENELKESRDIVRKIKMTKGKIMLSTLWDNTCGGFTDDNALLDPDNNWGKAIELEADLICTDRPYELVKYLRKRKLHD